MTHFIIYTVLNSTGRKKNFIMAHFQKSLK
nr:MAG TPA: hypothetical protein [Caudoviricetes sp.]